MSTKCPKNVEKCPKKIHKLSDGLKTTLFGHFSDNFCRFGRCFCLVTLSNAHRVRPPCALQIIHKKPNSNGGLQKGELDAISRRTPNLKGSYSPRGGVLGTFWKPPSQNPSENPSQNLVCCKTHSRPLLRTLLRTLPRTLPRTFWEPFLERCIAVRPLSVHPNFQQ